MRQELEKKNLIFHDLLCTVRIDRNNLRKNRFVIGVLATEDNYVAAIQIALRNTILGASIHSDRSIALGERRFRCN